MLDIKFIRENPDLIREAARKKHIEFDVNRLLETDEKRRTLLQEVEEMRSRQNKISEEVARTTDTQFRNEAIESSKQLKHDLQHKEFELKVIEDEFRELMFQVPNVPDPSVPEGDSDADNQEVRRWGFPRQFDFEIQDHMMLMRNLKLVDFERGAKVSGFRGYFLKNEAADLSFALWQLVFETFRNSGYQRIIAPALVKEENLFGTGHFPTGREDVYKIQDDLYLSATAEIPLMGFHSHETFQEAELPKKYLAFSSCYRREAGAYGKDTRGLFRLHEFFKVEQLILCRNDHQESVRFHEELTANAEKVLQTLELPYRVVVNCGGDIGRAHVKTYDIEVWIPSEKRYRESHSSSYYHDFQTRRLNIKYKTEDGGMKFCHSLNNTAIATPRILISLLENHQQEDGSVLIPKALQSLVGQEFIKPR